MKSNLLGVLIIIIFLSGCKRDSEEKKLFNSFVSQMPEVKLPFQYDSDKQLSGIVFKNRIDEAFYPPGPTLSHIVGYIRSDSSTIHVISIFTADFVQNLIIDTFNEDGRRLNSISPSFDNCAGAPPISFNSCKEVISIERDKTIKAVSRKELKENNNSYNPQEIVKVGRLFSNGSYKEENL